MTLQRIKITIVKDELQRFVRILKTCQPESRMDFLKQLQHVLPSAISLLEETRDQELQELIAQVETATKLEMYRK